ncbi:MAG TPA: GNAT family N-acetyltransferase [Thermomicrobiales bacterium]|nr:GNAT family N-acetyltransferase [Thermomicrobiales bacterium]
MVACRLIRESDAEQYLDLCLALDRESQFMMYEPDERRSTVDAERDRIRDVLTAPNQAIIVAEAGEMLAGYIELYGGEFRRVRHVACIVAGVRASHAVQGIGSALFHAGEDWARQAGVSRLELTVMTHNEAAVRLYQRRGFLIEGTRRGAMRVDGHHIDEFNIDKLLDQGVVQTNVT